jgi:hypothetical protein
MRDVLEDTFIETTVLDAPVAEVVRVADIEEPAVLTILLDTEVPCDRLL